MDLMSLGDDEGGSREGVLLRMMRLRRYHLDLLPRRLRLSEAASLETSRESSGEARGH